MPNLTADDWKTLRNVVRGSVALPEDSGYQDARPWNRAITVHPAAVVTPLDEEDISHLLVWAGDRHVKVTPQTTGHSAMPWGPDTVVALTHQLDTLEIDAVSATARVGAGVQWQRVVEEAARYGLMPVTGSSPGVGAVGFLSGGGLGPFARATGVASDWIISCTVVTGDGEVRTASPSENSDLFWALRGSKGALGVMTEVTIELLRTDHFYGGNIYVAGDDIGPVLRAWADWAEALPEAATSSAALMQLPPMPGLPEPITGRPTLSIRLGWIGDDFDEHAAHAILADVSPVFGEFSVMPATAVGAIHQDPPDPTPAIEAGYLLAGFPSEAAEALLACSGPSSGSPLLAAEVRQLGGAAERVPASPDAFCGRVAPYNLMLLGVPAPDTKPIKDANTRIEAALRPWASDRMLANFVVRGDKDALDAFYDDHTAKRLALLSQRYDPAGVLIVGQAACLTGA